MQARPFAIQILHKIFNFVRNLFGVFQDLCGYTLGIAFCDLTTMPDDLVNEHYFWKSQKC